jgi:cell division protein FtsB
MILLRTMNGYSAKREKRMQWLSLAFLLLLGAMSLVGPYGLLAWGEQSALLERREQQIASLEEDRAVLANRVERLNPAHVDPDFASELARKDLNVAHPDEYIIDLEPQP